MGLWDETSREIEQQRQNQNQAASADARLAGKQQSALKEFVDGVGRIGVPPSAIPLTFDGSRLKGAVIMGWRLPIGDAYTAHRENDAYLTGDVDALVSASSNAAAVSNNRDLIVTPDAKLYQVNMRRIGHKYVAQEIELPHKPWSSFDGDLIEHLKDQLRLYRTSGRTTFPQPATARTTLEKTIPFVRPGQVLVGILWAIVFGVGCFLGSLVGDLFDVSPGIGWIFIIVGGIVACLGVMNIFDL